MRCRTQSAVPLKGWEYCHFSVSVCVQARAREFLDVGLTQRELVRYNVSVRPISCETG